MKKTIDQMMREEEEKLIRAYCLYCNRDIKKLKIARRSKSGAPICTGCKGTNYHEKGE